MHVIADADTDENCFGINFSLHIQTQLFFAVWRGPRVADRNIFGIIFYFIADTDAEKYYFRIISAMNSDKWYSGYDFVGAPRFQIAAGIKDLGGTKR